MLSHALVVAIAVIAEAQGSSNGKPACHAHLRGLLWPLEVNHNPRLLVDYSRSGEIEICSKGKWKHQWTSLVVNVRQLRKTDGERTED